MSSPCQFFHRSVLFALRSGGSVPNQKNMWSCPICTCDNADADAVCQACGEKRAVPAVRPASASVSRASVGREAWNCSSCGDKNPSADEWEAVGRKDPVYTCQKCGNDRRSGSAPPVPVVASGSRWKCGSCNYDVRRGNFVFTAESECS